MFRRVTGSVQHFKNHFAHLQAFAIVQPPRAIAQLGAGAGLPRLAWIPSGEVLLEGGWSIRISISSRQTGLMLQILTPEP